MSTPAHLRPEGDGTTPLTPDEAAQLKPSWIIDRGALHAAEARAIAKVQQELMKRPPALPEILDDLWLRQLHRRMFGAIWEWAGSYRATERNIGVDPRHIAVVVRGLVDDARVWFDNERPVRPAVRFHHRLVQIHPFPDGNGRHGRLATDACLRACGAAPFTWGANLVDVPMQERRQRYYAALRRADRDGDLSELEQYVQA